MLFVDLSGYVDGTRNDRDAMRHIDLLGDDTSWYLHLHDFNDELDKIIAMHRYLVVSAHKQFSAEWDRLMDQPGDGTYDGGDALWDAEKNVSVNPWDLESHAGLMAVTRAVSLTEVMFARIAAAKLVDPARYVFPDGLLWFREWEMKFFKTALVTPFKTAGSGFGTLRSLRDLYVHGYGIPTTEERRTTLARKLYNQFDTGPITSSEAAAGYQGDAYFFGSGAAFSPKTNVLESSVFDSKRADISALATYRVLEALRSHFAAAFSALSDGLREDSVLTASKFTTAVDAWWSERSERDQKAPDASPV
jgi:hypothetical protein